MHPAEALQQGERLVIEHPIGGNRYPAHLFAIDKDGKEDGIAWIEWGWAEEDTLSMPSNPIHMEEGQLEEQRDHWLLVATTAGRSCRIRILNPDVSEDREKIGQMNEMTQGDREQARGNIESDLQISTLPL